MRSWFFPFFILVFGLLQVTLLDCIRIFYLKPDLLLICMVIASLLFEFRKALVFSIFAGLFKDIFSVGTFGTNTILFAGLSFLILRVGKEVTLDDDLVRLILILAVSLLYNILSALLSFYMGRGVGPGIILRAVLFGSMYTAVFFPLVFKLFQSLKFR